MVLLESKRPRADMPKRMPVQSMPAWAAAPAMYEGTAEAGSLHFRNSCTRRRAATGNHPTRFRQRPAALKSRLRVELPCSTERKAKAETSASNGNAVRKLPLRGVTQNSDLANAL